RAPQRAAGIVEISMMVPEDQAPTVKEILEPLRRLRSGSADSADLLRSSRLLVESNSKQLENPKAVLEYIDFFLDFFERTTPDPDGVLADSPPAPRSRSGLARA